MASSSSSSINLQSKAYDVFISFKGTDIRDGFLSHFQKELKQNQIDVFVDEELEKGEEISSSLLAKIEESYLSVVIFSENYAYSPWCLDELVKILECNIEMEQMILPVFYGVDPADVQELKGSYGGALGKYKEESNYDSNKVDTWINALKKISNLSGWDSRTIKSESKLIEKIINHISKKLDDYVILSDFCKDGLVGINSRVKDVHELLCQELEDVRCIGICGMGGIGKTTIASKLFEQICNQFQGGCLIANVREKLKRYTPDNLQSEILSKVFQSEGLNMGILPISSAAIKRRLSRQKFLIVLDDVSDLEPIEFLIGKQVVFGPGSRIIVTSRDKQLLKNTGAKIYEVKKLNDDEALQLFSFHAFKQNLVKKEYMQLARKAIGFADGNPLALKVLGSNLFDKTTEAWEDKLEKLKDIPDRKIQEILRISYDDLDQDEREIFLDIACFFKRWDKNRAISILEGCGFFAKCGISRLIDKSLISISKGNRLEMHDLIQQMGKDIVGEAKEIGKRSRLYNSKDIYKVLTKDTSLIRAFNLSLWAKYPLKALPSKFCPQNLVELHMRRSQLKQLWNDDHAAVNLKVIDLANSRDLIRIPDFSRSPKLKVLILSGCTSLVEISSSIGCLSQLRELELNSCISLKSIPSSIGELKCLFALDFSGCSKLSSLPDNICNLKSLIELKVSKCVNLNGLPENLGNLESLKRLYADESGIKKLPSSMNQLRQLCELACSKCKNLVEIPSSIGCLLQLREFEFNSCMSLKSIPSSIGELNLYELDFSECLQLTSLPETICNLKSLIYFNVSGCLNLSGLPKNLGNLESLKRLLASESGITKLPSSMNQLRQLYELDCSGCVNLAEIPDPICDLKSLKTLKLSGCVKLSRLPENLGNLESLQWLYADETRIMKLPSSINQLRYLIQLNCSGCKGLILPLLTGLTSLRSLHLNNCQMLELPDSLGLGSLTSLESITLCENDFESIPESIKQLSVLKWLDLRGCKRLKYLPELSLPSLTYLCVSNCMSLRSASIVFLPTMNYRWRIYDFSNCINLDGGAYRSFMDNVLAANIQVKANCYGARLIMAGSEVPQRMRYQNGNGSSLSFSLGKCNLMGLSFCAVLDPKIHPSHVYTNIGCMVLFKGKSGYSRHEKLYWLYERWDYQMKFQSEHVFLWGSSSFLDSNYSFRKALFQFFVVCYDDDGAGMITNREKIVKCGVHPIFKHKEKKNQDRGRRKSNHLRLKD
uniref:ADP-ribosyl cyclase/cyclic ADP-ribose hydrolase n=2 Tax=Manihot esculenta TaxID=3983 RepID=A0A2C9ULW0_MANES